MLVSRVLAVCVLSTLAAACGGGGGGSSSPPSSSAPPPSPPAPPPPEPKVDVSVATAGVNLDLAEGDEFPVEVAGSWSATDLPAGNSVYLEIRDGAARFQQLPAQVANGSSYTLSLKTSSALATGSYNGSLVVRACRDATCTQTYSGTTGSLNYDLRVAAVKNWETHQRDSAHSGNVPIWLDATKFAWAWEWSRPQDGEPIGGINAVVTRKGAVYASTDVYFGQGVLAALNETDGTEAWRAAFGIVPALGPPAVNGDTVFVATTGHEDTFLWAFAVDTGVFRRKSAFEGQWPHTLSPTIFDDRAYVGAGYYGGTLYSFSTVDGSRAWEYVSGGAWDMFTPSVDENFVYHYDGGVLHLVDKVTGAAAATIADPFGTPASHSYHGSPVIGRRNNVIAFARGAFSGRASSNVE